MVVNIDDRPSADLAIQGSDLVFMTATELAAAICSGAVSATEVVEAYLAQIAAQNPDLCAIVTLDAERARQQAALADAALERGEIWGPLHGVPITVKDVFETAGLRTTSSYGMLRNYVPHQDATIVQRLRAVGAIILGKTNLPERAVDIQT
ncbi:MAG: amidase, partial [Chloroflexi bacterium]|nr:amidase [Chloroflexota bacterium]